MHFEDNLTLTINFSNRLGTLSQ